ncbi:Uncharacterised protein [Serratia fonticola]|uniref:Uncharacterized protein n=1 Tax=Serratia fonticola TaxID=47917 RepID=A0A4U9THK5_SERFO|nr:Uncharacterised protein [Serratia fonticola]
MDLAKDITIAYRTEVRDSAQFAKEVPIASARARRISV